MAPYCNIDILLVSNAFTYHFPPAFFLHDFCYMFGHYFGVEQVFHEIFSFKISFSGEFYHFSETKRILPSLQKIQKGFGVGA